MPHPTRNDYLLMTKMVADQKEEPAFCPMDHCIADKEWGKHRNLCANCPAFILQAEDFSDIIDTLNDSPGG